MKKLAISMVGALTLWLGSSLVAQQSLPYETGFELEDGFQVGSLLKQEGGGWTVDQGEASIDSDVGRKNSQALVIKPSEPFGQVSLHLERPRGGTIVFSDFWVKPVAAEGESEEFVDAEGAITGFFKIDGKGQFHVLDGNGERGGEWKTAGETLFVDESGLIENLVRVTLRQDFGAKTWDLYLDGQLTYADLGFWDDSVQSQSRFTPDGAQQIPVGL